MTGEELTARKQKTADLLTELKDARVHWCARCGHAFSEGGARTLATGDPDDCHERMLFGSRAQAIASLRGDEALPA